MRIPRIVAGLIGLLGLLAVCPDLARGVERIVNTANGIQSAVSASGSGDIVTIQGGEYFLPDGKISLYLQNSGVHIRVASGATVTLHNRIVFEQENITDVRIEGIDGTLIIDGGEDGACLVTSSARRLHVERLECQWVVSFIDSGLYESTIKDVHIHDFGVQPDGYASRGCYHSQCQNCISDKEICPWCWVAGQNNPRIDRCHAVYTQGQSYGNIFDGLTIHDGDSHAFHIYGCGESIFRNNHTYNIPGAALAIYYNEGCSGPNGNGNSSNQNNLIENNLFRDSPGAGIWVSVNHPGNRVFNNTIVNLTGGPGIQYDTGTQGGQIRNNIVLNTNGGIQNSSSSTASNNLCDQANGSVGCAQALAGNVFQGGGDYHLKPGSPAINAGIAIAGGSSTDIEGQPRSVGTIDIGAYECQGTGNEDCGGGTIVVPPMGEVARLECNGNFVDSENGFTFTGSGGVLSNGTGIIAGNSCVFDGVNDLITGPNDAAFRPANVGMALWMHSTTAPVEFCHLARIGSRAVMGIASTGKFYVYVNSGTIIESPASVLNGMTHLLGLGYDQATGMLRLWVDNANPVSLNVGAGQALSYAGNEVLQIGGTGAAGNFCAFTADNIRMNDEAWTPTSMQAIYSEVPLPQPGLAFTHWRFYQADAPEGTTIAGQGVDAPNIVQARSGKLLMGANIKRVGSSTPQHYSLECNLNGSPTFVTLDNSCVSNPACITTDSVKNMGDLTTDLGDIPGDGFLFVQGRYVVDTINSAAQTTLADGEYTVWRYGLAFRQTLAHGDVVRCRPRTASGALDTYPPVLPTITMDVPVLPSATGLRMEGGTIQGATRR